MKKNRDQVLRNKKIEELLDHYSSSSNNTIRYWATLHLKDHKKLEHLAMTDSVDHIRKEAVKKIVKNDTLYEIALNDKNNNIKEIAIRKLNNKILLMRLRLILDPSLQRVVVTRLKECE